MHKGTNVAAIHASNGRETSMAETETLASPVERRPRRDVCRSRDVSDRDVEMQVVIINAVVNKLRWA